MRIYGDGESLADPDRKGSGQRPRSPLVPRLRRLFHPRPDEEGAGGAGHSPREDGVHLRHRLLQPLPLLHEHLRLPHHPRPGADHRHRPEGLPARPSGLGHHRRRRRPVDRRQPPDPRHPPQRRPQDHPVQQRDLRPDQGPVLADLAAGHADQVEPAGLDRQSAAAAVAGHRRRGDLRRPHRRRRHQPPDGNAAAGGGPQGDGVRRDLSELQDLQRRRLRVRHRQERQGRQHALPGARQAA